VRREAAQGHAVDEGPPLQILQIAVVLALHLAMEYFDGIEAHLRGEVDAHLDFPSHNTVHARCTGSIAMRQSQRTVDRFFDSSEECMFCLADGVRAREWINPRDEEGINE
jgi:hypothetical protein